MKRLLLVILFLISVTACVTVAHAQEIMKGIVVDSATFAPLAYVSIHVKGKGTGTSSDIRGNFSIVATRNDTLIFSLLGYERIEYPLFDYEASVIRMAERATMLKDVTIDDSRMYENPYENMFDTKDPNWIRANIPFYFSKARKDKIKAGRWREENLRVETYVSVVINNPETKRELMRKYALSEKQYYEVLTKFNEQHYSVMYYLTEPELKSFLTRFFESESNR